MTRLGTALGALAALVFATAPCRARLVVVTSTPDLADVVRGVGGDRVQVSSIASGAQDLHFIDAKPSTMLQARAADLYVEVGMELDQAWAGAIAEGSRNAKIAAGRLGRMDASARVVKLEVPTGTLDRSHGDVHALGNPHYWLDPWNVRIVAEDVAARLEQLDPEGKAAYRQGLVAFRRRVDEAMFGKAIVESLGGDAAWRLARAPGYPASLQAAALANPLQPRLSGWAGRLAPYGGARVYTHHRSWTYLLARFGLASAGEIEPRPGIPPTPGHLVGLVAEARRQPVRAILVEPFYGDQAAKLVAGQLGVPVLRLPLSAGGDPRATDWFALMDLLVAEMEAAFAAKG